MEFALGGGAFQERLRFFWFSREREGKAEGGSQLSVVRSPWSVVRGQQDTGAFPCPSILGAEERKAPQVRSTPRAGDEASVGRGFGYSFAMSLTLEIPDEVSQAMQLPPPEIKARLQLELAISLYAQAILSLGKAADLAGLSRWGVGRSPRVLSFSAGSRI